jgi:hypothetical protein
MNNVAIVHAYNPLKRTGEVRIGDFVVASTNYNATGWAGLELLEEVSNNLAEYFGVEVTDFETGGDENE